MKQPGDLYIYKEGTLYDKLKGFLWGKEVKGEIGLEIETEVKVLEDYPKDYRAIIGNGDFGLPYWSSHRDGSLRNFGIEYVLKSPLDYKDIPDALFAFGSWAKNVKFLPDPVKCSDHVHLNFMNASARTLGNFLTLYLLYENLLIKYSGPNRFSNMFCLPMKDAEDNLNNIVQILEIVKNRDRSLKGLIPEENCKYSCLNTAAFHRYGSLEIRCFRGETDTKEIRKWIDIVYALYSFAKRKVYPSDIIEMYFSNPQELFWSVFSTTVLTNDNSLVRPNLWYAGKVAYYFSPREWDELSVVKVLNTKRVSEQRETISKDRFLKEFSDLGPRGQKWVDWYITEGINT